MMQSTRFPKSFPRVSEPLNLDVFTRVWGEKVLVEGWRREYNEIGVHGSLGHRPASPKAIQPVPATLYY